MATNGRTFILLVILTANLNYVDATKVFIPRELMLIGEIGVDVSIDQFQNEKIADVLPKLQQAWNQTMAEDVDSQRFILLNRNTKKPITWFNVIFPINYQTKESEVSFIIGEYVRFQTQVGPDLLPPIYELPIDYLETIRSVKRKLDANINNVELTLVIHAQEATQEDRKILLDNDAAMLFDCIRGSRPSETYHIIAKYNVIPGFHHVTSRTVSAPPSERTRAIGTASESRLTTSPSAPNLHAQPPATVTPQTPEHGTIATTGPSPVN